MSKKKSISRIIWAFDPFESKAVPRPNMLWLLKLLHEKTDASIEPVYVLSPDAIQLQMSLSQPHLKQYIHSVEKALKGSLKGRELGNLVKPKVVVQPRASLRRSVDALLSHARTRRASLIVVGTHANKGWSRLMLGSFSETLLLHSKAPVLIVNPQARARAIRRILFPTDLSPLSRPVFKRVCALAKELGAEVALLHTLPHPIEPIFQSGVYLLGGGWVSMPEYMRSAEAHAGKIAAEWKREAEAKGARVSTYLDFGRDGIKQSILARARELEVGMIALEAQSGAARAALVGSITRQVVREAPCPVWVLRG